MNKALEQLKSSVEEVCAFHRQDKGVTPAAPGSSPFLCAQSLDQYHAAEDFYLKELTSYTKKQFFNVCSMCGCFVAHAFVYMYRLSHVLSPHTKCCAHSFFRALCACKLQHCGNAELHEIK